MYSGEVFGNCSDSRVCQDGEAGRLAAALRFPTTMSSLVSLVWRFMKCQAAQGGGFQIHSVLISFFQSQLEAEMSSIRRAW